MLHDLFIRLHLIYRLRDTPPASQSTRTKKDTQQQQEREQQRQRKSSTSTLSEFFFHPTLMGPQPPPAPSMQATAPASAPGTTAVLVEKWRALCAGDDDASTEVILTASDVAESEQHTLLLGMNRRIMRRFVECEDGGQGGGALVPVALCKSSVGSESSESSYFSRGSDAEERGFKTRTESGKEVDEGDEWQFGRTRSSAGKWRDRAGASSDTREESPTGSDTCNPQ